MVISEQIPIEVEDVLSEMWSRQGLPWNNGRITDYHSFENLNKLFKIINSGIEKEDFMFQGDLYRIHTPYIMSIEFLDESRERLIDKVCEDGSCSVLPYTNYSDVVVSYSKSPDFTRDVYYKVSGSGQAVILHVNTGYMYGIDVNAFYKRLGLKENRYTEEQEVLFPITMDTLVKEYWCTPKQFRYYMRNYL